jgi:hypothetical protein
MPIGGAPVTLVDRQGNDVGGVSASSPSFSRSVGSSALATGQAASSISPAAATLIVPARAGRQSVVISNITGTQPVYLGTSAVAAATGLFVAGAVGASVSIPTAAAIYATSPTAAQTLSYMETY